MIRSALGDGFEVEAVSPDDRSGRLIVRTKDGRKTNLKVTWAGRGWPQDVREATARVGDPWPEDTVLLAPHFSPGSIEWLKERGANWVDKVGQVRIVGPGGLIVIREPVVDIKRGSLRPPAFNWSSSALAIAEVILAQRDRPLRVAELAEESGWSVAQAAKVLKAFDEKGWTTKEGAARGPGARRALIDADGMLAAWSDALGGGNRQTRVAHRAGVDLMSILREDLAPALEGMADWAVSGWAGLELAAPYVTYTPSLQVYVAAADFQTPLAAAIEKAGLREVGEGGRVTFWAADDRVFAASRRAGEIPVVSAPRLFADLTSLGGRGFGAADHVKEELIDPLHPGRRTDVGSR